MKTKTMYQCDYCPASHEDKAETEEHEKNCEYRAVGELNLREVQCCAICNNMKCRFRPINRTSIHVCDEFKA